MQRWIPRAAMVLCLSATAAWTADKPLVEVWRSPACGCCEQWVKHLQKRGFATKVIPVGDTAAVRRASGMPAALGPCHTAKVGGYVIEGHVPAGDIERLLVQRPDARGLSAPGMPAAAPGMDVPNSPDYDVVLVRRDGTTELFARHNGNDTPKGNSREKTAHLSLSCRTDLAASPCAGRR